MDESLIREQEAQLQKTGRYYKHICFMAVPVLCMACFLYGVRPLLLCGIAVLTGNLCDRLVSLLRRRVYQGGDFSNESFALVIALLMPVTVDIYVLIAAVLAGVLIGKEIFGGYGSYPFNPAAVGYVVAAVSWPEQVFRYPQPYTNIPLWDASMVPVSSAIEDTLRSGGMLNIGSLALGLGEYAAPMGTGAALVILACGLFLWTQKDAHMSASISFLVTCAVIAFFFPRQAGLADSAVLSNILPRLQCVRDELLTGAILFSAVFLINEPYTCVHHRMGRVLYGVLVGVVSMGFRYYGVYETGVCFALLAVNSVSAWIDRTEAKLYHLTHLQADAGKEGSTMRRATAELIVKDPNKFAHHDRVFLNNPVVMQGMGLAPLVVLATSGQNAVMLAVAVALLLVPSRVLACLLSRLVPLHDEDPAPETLQKKLLPRALVYGFSTAVVYLAVYPILNMLFSTSLLSLGIYLPLLTVEPLLTYRFGRVQETVRKAVSKGLRITVGYALLLVLLGCVREWLAAGTMFGVVVSRPVLPMASMPAGGFIVLGVLCAVWRALAQKRKAYLTKEARNLVDVHSQKEADREQ